MNPEAQSNSTSYGLVTVQNNEQIDRQKALESADAKQMTPMMSGLLSHVNSAWQANKTAKQRIEKVLIECLMQRNGEYSSDVLERLRQQGEDDPIYMMITDIKCRAAISWIKDVMLPAGEAPAHFEPTPIPNLPPEKVQEAKQKIVNELMRMTQEMGVSAQQMAEESPDQVMELMERVRDEMRLELDEQAMEDAETMTREVNDEMVDGEFYQEIDKFIDDFVTFPSAFFEGPILQRKKKMVWKPGPNGKSLPVVETIVCKKYEAISPFDMYPSSGAKTLQDGNLIIHKRLSPRDLQSMIGVKGFDDDAIRKVLDLYAVGGLKEWMSIESTRNWLEDHDNDLGDQEPKIDCLKFYGDIPGKHLVDWGVPRDQVPDDLMAYPAIVWKVGNYVISARLNPHPLGRRNVYGSSFIKKRGSIWGRGIPQVMKDIARICNSAARALQKNMAVASGPMVWMLADKMHPGQSDKIFPFKLWKFTSEQVSGSNSRGLPMGFFQARPIVRELLEIYQKFYDQASEVTGIPAYVYGSEKIGGAGETASGLSMLMNAASKGLRASVINIDNDVTKPSWQEHFLFIALTEPERVKGDLQTIARASDYLMHIEQLQIALEHALSTTGNPVDMEIIGLEGRAELLREYLKRLKIPVHKIVPDRNAIMQKSANKQIQMFVENLSKALGMDPQQLIQLAQGGQPQLEAA